MRQLSIIQSYRILTKIPLREFQMSRVRESSEVNRL